MATKTTNALSLGYLSRSILVLVLILLCLDDSQAEEAKIRETAVGNSSSDFIQLCGFRDHSPGFNRIVGGAVTAKGEVKWQVSIRLKHQNKLHHVCGGTVIGQSWILTAAHCVSDFKIEELVFVAGDYKIDLKEDFEQHRVADLFIEHEKYDPVSQENDIALVRVKEPFDFGSYEVAPACLPDPKQEFKGSCVVTGWGKKREGGKNANVLQKVWIPILSDEMCKKKMKGLGFDGLVFSTMICGGYDEGGKDACQGDSGGPYVCAGKGNLPVLVGIVSWGIGCARRNVPGIYTEVSYYVDWVGKQIKKNSPVSTNRGPFSNIQLQQQQARPHQQDHKRIQFSSYPVQSPLVQMMGSPSSRETSGIVIGSPEKLTSSTGQSSEESLEETDSSSEEKF